MYYFLIKYRLYLIPLLCIGFIGLWLLGNVPYGEEILCFNAHRHEPWNSIFQFLTYCAEPYAYILIVVTLLYLGWRHAAVLVGGLGLLTALVALWTKGIYETARPIRWFESVGRLQEVVVVPNWGLNGGYNSFPSGHTMSAFACYGFLSLFLIHRGHPKWAIGAMIIAAGAGISRIFLVQHFLIDVVTGAAIGTTLAMIMFFISTKSKYINLDTPV
jgi:membrane-associated phospholipid phosphatase